MRHIFCLLFLLFAANTFAGSNNWAPEPHKNQPTFQALNANFSKTDSHLFFHEKAVSEITAEEQIKSEKETEETVLESFTAKLNPYLHQRQTAFTGNLSPHLQLIPLFIFHHSWKLHISA